MKNKLILALLSLIIVASFTSCDKDDDPAPISGSPVNNAPAFNHIYVGNGKLYIEYGATYTFENYNSDDSSNYVIKNDTLFLYNLPSSAHIRINHLKSLTVQNWGDAYFTNPFHIEDSLYIYLSSASTLIDTLFTGGNLRIDVWKGGSDPLLLNFDHLNKLDVYMRSISADVKCTGTLDSLKIEKINYGCDFFGFDCQCNVVDVLTKYSGDIEVYANNVLKAEIRSSGDVFYKGNPTIEYIDNGSGELINSN